MYRDINVFIQPLHCCELGKGPRHQVLSKAAHDHRVLTVVGSYYAVQVLYEVDE